MTFPNLSAGVILLSPEISITLTALCFYFGSRKTYYHLEVHGSKTRLIGLNAIRSGQAENDGSRLIYEQKCGEGLKLGKVCQISRVRLSASHQPFIW